MADVFVSHASVDAVLVDQFVDVILKLGCGLKPEQIFYSSGEDTGVPSGTDLIHHVREQVGGSGLVIAIISPMFQTRPVCVAELGAAWSRTDNLLPLAIPDMARTDMEGVLQGMTVRHLDDSAALDELKDRVRKVTGTDSDTTTWGRHKAQWLAMLKGLAEKLEKPETVTKDEVERLRGDLVGTQAALSDSHAQVQELEERIRAYLEAESAEERAEALLPADERDRFEALTKAAIQALRPLDPIVRDAIWFDRYENGMPWPDPFEEPGRKESADKSFRDGTLTENAAGKLVPDDEVTNVAKAQEAVTRYTRCSRIHLSSSTSGSGMSTALLRS